MLEQILAGVRSRLPDMIGDLDVWIGRAAGAPEPRPFVAPLAKRGLSVIAEVKRRSPSAGDIAPDLDPVNLASAYAEGGARAISVLTDQEHFGGSLEDVVAVRASCDLPILRKDFVLHPVQVAQSRAAGADAVLLIVAALDDATLGDLITVTRGFGMDALVEAHDEAEVRRAVDAGATAIGVNNRDLTNFRIDLDTAVDLRHAIPDGVVAVAESGITDAQAARRMERAGYDAILVGQAAAESADPAGFIAALRSGQ